MQFDVLHYPYSSRRTVVYAKKGMVATSQPLAAQAGLEILKKGGNAIDAAIATAACLTVVEPTSNGVGGDAFALVWANDKLYGLNASGPAPQGISAEIVTKQGYNEIPRYGWIPVTVPGIPAAWAALAERFGRLPLAQTLRPAIDYAEKGYPVSPITGQRWQQAFALYKKDLHEEWFKHWFEVFAPSGRAPQPGEIWRSVELARTLQRIAETNGQDFYHGAIAKQIDQFSRRTGGYLTGEDLAGYQPEWVQPIKVDYRGYEVWELPPNGHGLVTLLALNMLKGFEFSERDNVETYHKQIEAMKLAFADGQKYIADLTKMNVSTEELLSEAYADERRRLITSQACLPLAGTPHSGGTVYLAAADDVGNMVSYIQSNYMGFGSGLVVPGTAISLHNRGHNFVLDQSHVNCLEPRKKPYHTIIPGFLTKAGSPVGPFGVMGAFMQPQGHLQVIMNTIDFQLNPQAVLDAPRWQWKQGKTVELESWTDKGIAEGLEKLGHTIVNTAESGSFGRGQIIWKDANGVLVGGTEPRTDGTIACW